MVGSFIYLKNNFKKMLFEDFHSFKIVRELKQNINSIPDKKGVYLVLFKNNQPVFLEKSIGGHFKGKDPSVPIEKLESNWISNEEIIYIGQAGGNGSNATLRKRLKQYLEFGSGKPVGHWGGRYIWQLKDSDELVITWKETREDPYIIESEMIKKFKEKHGERPFANLIK
jgi:hypothetical protein